MRWWWRRVKRSTASRSEKNSPVMPGEYPLIRMSYAGEELCSLQWRAESGHLVGTGYISSATERLEDHIVFHVPDENIAELRLQYVGGYGWALVNERSQVFYESDTDMVVTVPM